MPESIQHKLDRVRPPRVQITYDVETLGSIVKTELPFVVGIMADLSGNGLKSPVRDPGALPPLKNRKYVEIDRDNFNTIMEKIEPKVKLSSGPYSDTVTFTKLEDFNPINVLRNVTDLRRKFESRTRLANLVAKLDGNIKLQKKLAESYKNLPPQDKNALKNYYDVINPGETRVAGTPSVTKTTGKKDVLTATGLVISRNEADGDEVTHFKITEITGGELFKQPGAATDKIADNTFITFEEGQAGLRLKLADHKTGSFKVQSSTSGDAAGLGGEIVTVTIPAVGAPSVTKATTKKGEMTATGLVISRNEADGDEVTHFKITEITGGELFKQPGAATDKIADNTFITFEEGQAGLKFKASGDANGSFKVQSSTSGTDNTDLSDIVTVTVTVEKGRKS